MHFCIHSTIIYFALIISFRKVKPYISQKAKCAIECYSKCANSGTPRSAYCNCPLNLSSSNACSSISELLLKEKTLERPIEAATMYQDVRTILIKTEAFPNAFIYIFEHSAISSEPPNWNFAGVSPSPLITLSTPDACRDYQFRVVIVLRTTDPQEQIIVFRPKTIPVILPPFVVPEESIRLEQPSQSPDRKSLDITISWKNPHGYENSDIYGYDGPSLYPLSCQIAEDRLNQPKVVSSNHLMESLSFFCSNDTCSYRFKEMIEGGARMRTTISVEALQERCRMMFSVRMIPRCIRINYFDINASVELNCKKFPALDYCKREMSPECTEMVEIWGGENGNATIVWQPPDPMKIPLYYVANWGVTQVQGFPPFKTRRILNGAEIQVPGNQTTVEISPTPGTIPYGLQICGIYSFTATQSPFNIIPVVPFTCNKCPIAEKNSSCIACQKIEEAKEFGYQSKFGLNEHNNSEARRQQFGMAKEQIDSAPNVVLSDGCMEMKCKSRNHALHYISSEVTSLEVSGAHPQRNLLTQFVSGHGNNEIASNEGRMDVNMFDSRTSSKNIPNALMNNKPKSLVLPRPSKESITSGSIYITTKYVEPSSTSGRPDKVLSQEGANYFTTVSPFSSSYDNSNSINDYWTRATTMYLKTIAPPSTSAITSQATTPSRSTTTMLSTQTTQRVQKFTDPPVKRNQSTELPTKQWTTLEEGIAVRKYLEQLRENFSLNFDPTPENIGEEKSKNYSEEGLPHDKGSNFIIGSNIKQRVVSQTSPILTTSISITWERREGSITQSVPKRMGKEKILVTPSEIIGDVNHDDMAKRHKPIDKITVDDEKKGNENTTRSLMQKIEAHVQNKGLLIIVGPILFIIASGSLLFFFCLTFLRSKRRGMAKNVTRNYLTSYKYEPTNQCRRIQLKPYIIGSSALAAKTNAAAIAANRFIHHPSTTDATDSSSAGSSSSSSRAMLDASQSNYYSDNTARFLLADVGHTAPSQASASSSVPRQQQYCNRNMP